VNVGIVVFPGSNCDADTYRAVRDVLGQHAQYVWHEERSLRGLDAVVLPGGFSYGDYLRAGAIATTSPAVRALRPYVERGGLVLGICNGFQTLLEAGLLPGAMLPNLSGEFRCQFVQIRVERADTPFTCACEIGDVLRIPIAHAEGRYVMDPGSRPAVAAHRQVVLRYCDPEGTVVPEANPNGSEDAIAGLATPSGAVFGLMPHPERACEAVLGSTDGLRIFESLEQWIASGRSAGQPAEVH
jgi:phosphoribosylformylglycinamidine synthase subunit PurQ / glutaminase